MVPENVSLEQIAAGQAVYTKRMLGIYDWLVLGLSNRSIWRCPTLGLVAHYDRHVTAKVHLHVGVQTGHFLDCCRFPSTAPRVTLMDLNMNALDFAAKRIARYKLEIYVRNVLEPVPFDAMKFDSVGINNLLHCLPGSMDFEIGGFRSPQDRDESGCRHLWRNFAARRRRAELARETPHGLLQWKGDIFE